MKETEGTAGDPSCASDSVVKVPLQGWLPSPSRKADGNTAANPLPGQCWEYKPQTLLGRNGVLGETRGLGLAWLWLCRGVSELVCERMPVTGLVAHLWSSIRS